MQNIQIGKHSIGETHKPFVIAEMSGNHNQSLDRALEIVDAAACSGAHQQFSVWKNHLEKCFNCLIIM